MFESAALLQLKRILYAFRSAQYVASVAARFIPSAPEVGQELTLPDTRRPNVLTQNPFTAESTLRAPIGGQKVSVLSADGALPVLAGERDWFKRARRRSEEPDLAKTSC
jgi:hypothetical protein